MKPIKCTCKRCGYKFTTRVLVPSCPKCSVQGWDKFEWEGKK